MGKRTQLDRRNEFKLLLYRKVIRVNIFKCHECVRVCMRAKCVYNKVSKETRKDPRSVRAGVAGDCEPPDGGAGN